MNPLPRMMIHASPLQVPPETDAQQCADWAHYTKITGKPGEELCTTLLFRYEARLRRKFHPALSLRHDIKLQRAYNERFDGSYRHQSGHTQPNKTVRLGEYWELSLTHPFNYFLRHLATLPGCPLPAEVLTINEMLLRFCPAETGKLAILAVLKDLDWDVYEYVCAAADALLHTLRRTGRARGIYKLAQYPRRAQEDDYVGAGNLLATYELLREHLGWVPFTLTRVHALYKSAIFDEFGAVRKNKYTTPFDRKEFPVVGEQVATYYRRQKLRWLLEP